MDAQSEFFDKLWNDNKNRSGISELAAYDPSAVFISLIANVDLYLAERIHNETYSKVYETFPDAFIYLPSQYHMTVVGFPPFSDMKNNGIDIRDLENVISESVDSFPSIQIELRNLNVLPGTLVVEAYDISGKFRVLTSAISDKFLMLLDPVAPSVDLKREKWWITLARLQANIKDMVSLTKKYRPYLFGSFNVAELELVSTDKMFTPAKTKVITKYPLTPSGI